MNAAYAYLQLYRLFDNLTAVPMDCGFFCGKACCKGDSETGMYLFPGEEKVFELLEPEWAAVEDTDFSYMHNGKRKTVKMLTCSGACDRYQRPLACRIFPFTPYIEKSGRLCVITDPRAKSLCPLTDDCLKNTIDSDMKFRNMIEKAFALLDKNGEVHNFLLEYSRLLDEYKVFFDGE